MATPNKPIITSPQTDSQLRALLNRLKRNQTTLVADLGKLEDVFLREGTAGGAVATGNVLYASSSGGVDRAIATAANTALVIGVALNDAAIGGNVVYLTLGVVTLAGLTSGAAYYLSAVTPGAITTVAPSTVGQYVVPIGKALSSTELLFSPLTSVLL